MGQGHYAALVWGVAGDAVDAVYVTDDDGDRDIAAWASEPIYGWGGKAYIAKHYESRTPWLGAMAACTDYVVAERKKSVAILEYEAMPAADVAERYKPHVSDAQKRWEEFRKHAAGHGVKLPVGKLLLVFDYD